MTKSSELPASERKKLNALLATLAEINSKLTPPQFEALLRVALEPGLSVNELADRLACPQQTASRLAATLLGRYADIADTGADSRTDPLIVQEISQDDPRKRALFLSTDGSALLKRVTSKMIIK